MADHGVGLLLLNRITMDSYTVLKKYTDSIFNTDAAVLISRLTPQTFIVINIKLSYLVAHIIFYL